ncbi:hypothetical protein ACJJTC_015978 [Scirpophaga incertulas]
MRAVFGRRVTMARVMKCVAIWLACCKPGRRSKRRRNSPVMQRTAERASLQARCETSNWPIAHDRRVTRPSRTPPISRNSSTTAITRVLCNGRKSVLCKKRRSQLAITVTCTSNPVNGRLSNAGSAHAAVSQQFLRRERRKRDLSEVLQSRPPAAKKELVESVRRPAARNRQTTTHLQQTLASPRRHRRPRLRLSPDWATVEKRSSKKLELSRGRRVMIVNNAIILTKKIKKLLRSAIYREDSFRDNKDGRDRKNCHHSQKYKKIIIEQILAPGDSWQYKEYAKKQHVKFSGLEVGARAQRTRRHRALRERGGELAAAVTMNGKAPLYLTQYAGWPSRSAGATLTFD